MLARLSSLRPWLLSKPYRLLLLAVMLVVISLLLWRIAFATHHEKLQYNTTLVERGTIENLVTATGILQPRDYVDVGAQVSGQLKILHVDVGSEVKAGDLVAEIDATVYAANVDGTRAQLISQQAQLRDRDAQLKLARINFQRQQNLQKADASTQEALQSAEASLASVTAQLDALKAQIKQTESNLRVQEANLDYANIYAPMDGTVVSLTARQGQTLNANQTAPTIMRIADLSTMTVQTQVSEADVGKLRVGMPVYFTTLGSQGRRWYSQLDRIQPTPEVLNNVVLYNALFEVPNQQRVLMTQMSTQVFFISAQAKDVLLVPMSSLTFARSDTLKNGIGKNGENGSDRKINIAAAGKVPDIEGDISPQKSAGETSGEKSVQSGRDKNIARNREKRGGPDSSGNTETLKRQASVQVVAPNGRQETRSVTVGVTNRIQAEIISGLNEGEIIVIGVRHAEGAPRPAGEQRGFNPRMLR
jgi:macrolide-specific efflux system membrane fusion protein